MRRTARSRKGRAKALACVAVALACWSGTASAPASTGPTSPAMASSLRTCSGPHGYAPKNGGYALIIANLRVQRVGCERAAEIGGAFYAGDPTPPGWHCQFANGISPTRCRYRHTRRRFSFQFGGDAGRPALALRFRSFIQPDGGDSAYLTKPRRFSWVSDGVTGTASGMRWRHWNSPKAVGEGRTRFCVTMGGGCHRIEVKAIASQRRGGFPGPEGGRLFFYCHVILRGPFDDGRVLTISLPTPQALPCSG